MKTTGEKIERYGHLSKIETLRSVTVQKLPGTLVLEAPEPFPGSSSYYSEIPQVLAPLYVYFILDGFSDLELASRATQKVRTLFPWEFDAAFSSIDLNGETYNAIRVRHLNDFDHIPKLQESYQKVGVNFKKSTRTINGKGVITLKKLFHLTKFNDGLFLDRDQVDHGYFSVPWQLPHQEFRALVKRVKYNWDTMKIDVAQGWVYSEDRIENLVRIYNPEINLTVLNEIKKQFEIRL